MECSCEPMKVLEHLCVYLIPFYLEKQVQNQIYLQTFYVLRVSVTSFYYLAVIAKFVCIASALHSFLDFPFSEAATGGVLKNFTNFTGKHLCWSLFLMKLQATPILKNICERLLLHFGLSLLFGICWEIVIHEHGSFTMITKIVFFLPNLFFSNFIY